VSLTFPTPRRSFNVAIIHGALQKGVLDEWAWKSWKLSKYFIWILYLELSEAIEIIDVRMSPARLDILGHALQLVSWLTTNGDNAF
jgi:hypothetical protein